MPKIKFVYADGVEQEIDAPIGSSILDVTRMHDIDLEGACEGSLACSTCHVIIDQYSYDRLPKATEDEEDMLDLAFGLTHTSRLGCQVIISDEMENMIIHIPSATRNIKVNQNE